MSYAHDALAKTKSCIGGRLNVHLVKDRLWLAKPAWGAARCEGSRVLFDGLSKIRDNDVTMRQAQSV